MILVKATLDVYDGVQSYKFENNELGFETVISLSKSLKDTILIFEPTGIYSYALTEFCSKNKIKVVIVGPKESRDFARSLKVRSKTDKIDAQVLYRYQCQVEPKMVKVPTVDHQSITIQEMLNIYEGIQSAKQQFKNQVEATSKNNKDLVRTLNRLIDTLDNEAQKLFNKIELLLLKDTEIKERYDAISNIPSIGQKSSLYLCAFFLKYPLANAKEMTALLGLDPMMKDSGTFRGKQRISKHGGQKNKKSFVFTNTLCYPI